MIVLGSLYPKYVESLADLPLIGDFIPALSSMVIMIVFTMMAVGLNIVVGYAGSSTSATSPSTPSARTPRPGSRRSSSTR